jgi:hypothetical protein
MSVENDEEGQKILEEEAREEAMHEEDEGQKILNEEAREEVEKDEINAELDRDLANEELGDEDTDA